jgi:large subunit ribosomal protein L29
VDVKELRECTDERLRDLEQTLRRQIFDARIKNFTNQLDDTASIGRARKDLARVKTVLSERAVSERANAGSAAPAADQENE